MNTYTLVTDSTADIPAPILRQYGLRSVPFIYTIGDKDYHYYEDQREMSLASFYQQLRDGAMPRTSQVNPQQYEDFFREILEEGKDVIYLCFTSALSGSYGNALLAAENMSEKYPDRRVTVIDSCCASIAGACLALHTARHMAAEEPSYDEMVSWVKDKIKEIRTWFVVEDMFHLKRGGRVSAVEAAVATALKIKPILMLGPAGDLQVKAKQRGIKNAMDYLVDRVRKEGVNTQEQTILIGHASAPERAGKLMEILRENHLGKDYIITEIGPIIGTHVGAGMLAVSFTGKAEE